MINEERLQQLKTGAKAPINLVENLKTMSRDDLEELRFALSLVLPPPTLGDINLETELLDQFTKVKKLQADVMGDEVTPVNQKAQVANSVASTLQQLIKMQSEFHTAERFKAIEALMIKAMRKLPVEAAEAFLADYERIEV